jgi:transposase-like protein
MARQVNQVLWDQWRQRIDSQRTSGLSIVEFCRQERLSPHGFYIWRRKLRRTISSPPKAAVSRRLRKGPNDGTPRRRPRRSPADLFGAVRPSEFLQLPVTAMRPSPWVELSLADGTVVRLPQQNLTALVTVLRVLRGEPLDLPNAERSHA